MNGFEEIVRELTSRSVQREVFAWKALSILFSLFFIGIIAKARKETRWAQTGFIQRFHEFRSQEALEKSRFEDKWDEIKRRLEKEWESEAKLAIIEADEMLFGLLKRMGYTGEAVEERLKKVEEEKLESRDELERARRLRDDIVHDPDYHLPLEKGKWAIEVYEKVFKELGAF